ncbi:Uu.00g102990.m01.CDS01 [Anthostomella pinea]|uniref:Uu.00g102990.m01.CDS01 n=1 Tax=Anthostomella pinea TaxID=933095 RepID=A0AAI8YD56_9PEZI|nr:Uu.00g102990.m01.CDS01 [Anthostomella pinea]
MREPPLDLEHTPLGSIPLLPSFKIYAETYKQVNGQPIDAYIYIPKDLPLGKRPLLVRFHGGAFSEGTCDSWIHPWIFELALKHGAIMVSPDYRFRPESTLADELDDMGDFWTWVATTLPSVLSCPSISPTTPPTPSPSPELDLTNTAIVGESAGGYLTAQTALLNQTAPPIHLRALLMQYPLLSLARHLSELEALPETEKVLISVLEAHLSTLKATPGKIVTRVDNGARMELFGSMVHHGQFVSGGSTLAVGDANAYLDPMLSLETVRGAVPPTLLFHGREDTSVTVDKSEEWAEKFRRLQPDTPFMFVVRDGEEHIFDRDDTLATPWLKEPIEFVERFWPAK